LFARVLTDGSIASTATPAARDASVRVGDGEPAKLGNGGRAGRSHLRERLDRREARRRVVAPEHLDERRDGLLCRGPSAADLLRGHRSRASILAGEVGDERVDRCLFLCAHREHGDEECEDEGGEDDRANVHLRLPYLFLFDVSRRALE
jgi:hypothetical protein